MNMGAPGTEKADSIENEFGVMVAHDEMEGDFGSS